jgi:TonB-linked SusC/RagA family outer membrane protein
MKRILLSGFVLLSFLWGQAMAQERTVTGTVTSEEDGTPIPGVNVIIKGSSTGTVTDIDGKYTINVPQKGGVLVFTFIGLATEEVTIGAQSTIDMVMTADIKQLTEVVVTAVGIEREKKALGYGVETVEGSKLQQISEPDPLRGLQGKIAGVQLRGSSSSPGSATRITIRGNSSLANNNQPLFIVDGVPYNNNTNGTQNQLTGGGAYGSRIQDLDPNNIKSWNVLKGAAAAALYGTRAANGVVVITTKTGSTTPSRKGMEITYNFSYSFEDVANLPDYQNTYGTGTNFNYQQVNGSWGAPFIGTKPYASVETISHWYDGVVGFEDLWGTTVPYQAYPNNVKDFFRTGQILENSIQLSGGNEKSQISVVATHMTHDGVVPETEFTRTSISVGGRSQLDNGFIIGGNLQYTNSFQHTFQGGANNAVGNASAFARTLYLGRNWDLHGQPFQNPVTNASAFFVAPGQSDNPLWSVQNAGVESNTDRYLATVFASVDATEWLNIKYQLGINGYSQRQTAWFRPGSRGADGSGRITDDDIAFQEVDGNLLITANHDINENFSFRGILGQNYNQRTTDRQAFQGTGYVVFDIDDIDNTNDVIPFGGSYLQRRIIGVFADLNFGYRDYLFLTLSGRNDWSSTLPKANNSFFYPAVSLSYIFSDGLNLSSNFFSFGQLRASWAEVGNDTDPYLINQVYLVNQNGISAAGPPTQMPFNGAAGSTLGNRAPDPNLKPEIKREIELGLDLKFFDNRLGLDVAVYQNDTRNQIVQVAIPAESGFTTNLTNFGVVRNRGIEITLDATPVRLANGFNWNILGTFTHNRNTIEELSSQTDELVLRNTFTGGAQAVHIVGQEYGLIRGTVAARDQDGNLLVNPADGQLIEALELGIIGNPNPDFVVGLTNTFSWKGLSLSAVLDWTQGGDIYSQTNNSLLGRGVTKDTEDREVNRIIPGVYGDPNTQEPIRDENGNKIPNQTMVEVNTLYFGQTFAINASDEFSVWDGTFIRLREIVLSYTMPKEIMDSTPFGSARISLTGRNLWYNAPNFPKASNFDPEVSQFGNANAQGFEFTSPPSVRRFGVNVSLTF